MKLETLEVRGKREVKEVVAVRDGFKMTLLLLFFPVLPCLYSVEIVDVVLLSRRVTIYCTYIYLHPVQSVPEMIR